MDIIYKEGMLYLLGFKFGKRTWRKTWTVLFKPSSTGVGRLEFSNVPDPSGVTEQKKAGRQKTSERKVVRLMDCLSVTPAPKESCPQGFTAFYLNTTQSTYTLASTTSQDWMSALCLLAFQKDSGDSDKGISERGNALTMEDNDLYSSWKTDLMASAKCYQVVVQTTEASRRCKLAGDYLISMEAEALLLHAIESGSVIYRWPHRLLRKFGLVEGGFSIEAGRRCDSGEGLFIFLTTHGQLIFQAILDQCSLAKTSSVQTLNVKRRSLCDPLPLILPTTSSRAAGPTVYDPADASDDTGETHYSTIKEASAADSEQLSWTKPQLSYGKEAEGAEDEDEEEERCHSLEALKLDEDAEESIYYNLRRATPTPVPKDELPEETESSECVYAAVTTHDSPLNPQLQPFSPAPFQQPASTQSGSCSPIKPRHQRQPPVNNSTQAGFSAQTQLVDDMQETEEAIGSSARVGPLEVPGSFKHRLAEIISKDLAKFQPPAPSGSGSPAFTQY